MTIDLFYPKITGSKSAWVLDAFAQGTPNTEKHISPEWAGNVGVYWGLGSYNYDMVARHRAENVPWIFTDMPYFNRWLGDNRDSCHWRIVPNAIHQTAVGDFPDDRFRSLNMTVKDWRTSGEHILVCPSSVTVDRYINKARWLESTLLALGKVTDRPIKVRLKPRGNGTSGPRAAVTPFAEDCKNAWAIVTSVSLAGVEAACLGIPVFCHSESACVPIASMDLTQIENPIMPDRTAWLNTLAYYQYTEDEFRRGLHHHLIQGMFD